MPSNTHYPRLFEPIQLGSHRLRNRIMMPPHGRMVGDIFGSENEAQRNDAYWRSRAHDGVAWVTGVNGFIDNSVVPKGFRPTGAGAVLRGSFRLPYFSDRVSRFSAAIHAEGAIASAQIIHQGGMPHSPSGILANFGHNQTPHVMQAWEIEWFVAEYAQAARALRATEIDGIELHANHEDLLQLFISPATNRRTDAWGGDRERRLKFLKDVIAAVRHETGPAMLLGVRLNMDELFAGGYDLEEGVAIARSLEATGGLDYFHGVIGNNWGAPTYIQTHDYTSAQWAPMAGRFRAALGIPVVYSGRVADPATAERVLGDGHADIVGVARAMFADEHWVSKARTGRANRIRPCIGCNDCLHAQLVESTPFGCSVNPTAGRETEPPATHAAALRDLLVIGAGPAGLELAIRAAERGHRVRLWERDHSIGGQLRLAARALNSQSMTAYLDYQLLRLKELAVEIRFGMLASVENTLAAKPDVIAIATGVRSRSLEVPGADLPHVFDGHELLALADGGGDVPGLGNSVAVIAREDHMQPIAVASWLAERGHRVHLIYATPSIAPLIGKYSIGAALARLATRGVTFRVMERVIVIETSRLVTRNIFANVDSEIAGFDSVVVAGGAESNADLHAPLRAHGATTHILGDAYAPRRLWYATRQAYALAASL
jgi:2,4-dienoyl-CoA reductase-like NADH-dependent reductase (Old Yellow Enzyme family)/thioredoxin reductase